MLINSYNMLITFSISLKLCFGSKYRILPFRRKPRHKTSFDVAIILISRVSVLFIWSRGRRNGRSYSSTTFYSVASATIACQYRARVDCLQTSVSFARAKDNASNPKKLAELPMRQKVNRQFEVIHFWVLTRSAHRNYCGLLYNDLS